MRLFLSRFPALAGLLLFVSFAWPCRFQIPSDSTLIGPLLPQPTAAGSLSKAIQGATGETCFFVADSMDRRRPDHGELASIATLRSEAGSESPPVASQASTFRISIHARDTVTTRPDVRVVRREWPGLTSPVL